MDVSSFKFDQTKRTILIVDSFANGRAIVERLNKKGLGLINFEYETLSSLIEKQTNDYVSSHINSIEDIKKLKIKTIKEKDCTFILRNIVASNPSLLPFVKNTSYSLKTFAEVLRIVNIIRRVDIKNNSNGRANQLIELSHIFEDKLKEISINGSCGIYDNILLIKEFKDEYVNKDYEYYITKEYYESLLPLEKKVVDKFVGKEHLIKITSSNDVKPNTFTSYGKFNEVQGVLDCICKDDLNDVTIYYSSSIYENYLRAALKNRHIPYKFQNEISAGDNPIYCLLIDIINWSKNSYRFSLFKKICLNPLLNFRIKDCEGNFVEQFAQNEYEELKKAHINYSLERYEYFLDNCENVEYINAINDLSREPMNLSPWFIEFLIKLVQIFKENNRNPGSLLGQLVYFVNTYRNKRVDSEINSSVISFLFEYAKIVKLYGNAEDDIEVLDIVEEAIGMLTIEDNDDMFFSVKNEEEEMSVCSSYVNVCKLPSSFVLGRKINYFIGMSFNEFTLDSFDSPVLSDDIIDECFDDGHNNKLILNKYVQLNKDENFKQCLTTADKDFEINLVSCVYDTVNFQESSPSNLFMQYHRRPKDAPKYDFVYKNIIKQSVSHDFGKFCNDFLLKYPEQNVIKDEVDLNGNLINKAIYPLHTNIECYKKDERTIVRYKNISLSPSKIQTAFRCPYAFIYNISNIYLDDEEKGEKDFSSWLQANELGSMFHEILERYSKEYLINKNYPYNLDYSTVIDEIINKYLMVYGGSENFSNDITNYILTISKCINKIVDSLGDEKEVKYSELHCKTKPIRIDLDENRSVEFVLTGVIDRVDFDNSESVQMYKITDYKTGSISKIEDKIKKNGYLQHILYPYLLQNYLGKPIDGPVKFVYYSLDNNCESEPIYVDTSNFDALIPIGEQLFNIGCSLNKEQEVLEKNTPCTYCEMKDICFMRLKGKKPAKKGENND